MIEGVFPFAAISAEEVAKLCLMPFQQALNTKSVLLYGQSVGEKKLYREVQSRQHFNIEISSYCCHWGGVKNHNLAVLTTGESPTADERLLGQLCERVPLIIARQYDASYDYWQNAEDPLEYETEGRSMEGLPIKSNGLPPPLDQLVVDTSQNPGRRLLKDGYIEAIAHRMWLGPEFFRRVPGANREKVMSARWLKVYDGLGDSLEIIAHDAPFYDSTTEDIQENLRQLLFQVSSE